MTDEKNKRKLYDALSQDYDLGSFEQFSTDVEDEVKRRKLYDAIKEEYDFPDFDGFSRQLVGEPKPKPAAQQQVQPYNGDFTMRESELEKGNSQQSTGNRQQATKPAKTQPAKPKAAPITTPNIPSIQQMMDNRPQFKPVMQSEVGIDANGNRVRKPKVTKEPIGNTPQTAPVYRDFMGNTYDATDPNVQKEVERQTVTVPLDVKKANREQVADLSQSIDDALNDAKGEVMRLYREQSDILYPLGAPGADAIEMLASTRMMQKYGDGIPDAQVAGQRVRDLEAAQRSMRDAQRIINEADHNAKEGTFGKWLESSFAGGAVRGFGQKLFDVDTWDMGMSEMQDATSFKKALKAFDEGKQLTESQKLMLDAKAVELATNAYFGSYVGRGYKAGNVTAESVPFMIEMCLNPASGTGHAAQNAMARYAIKRFGKKVVKDNAKKYLATKVATRVAGDIVGAGIMAGTTGMVGVAADAQNRMNGDVRFDINDEGKSVFVGHDNQKDFGTAFKEAFAARTIENYSEMFGEYFSPLIGAAGKGIGKGLSKFGLDNVNKFVENVAASDIARLVSDFERRSKWNGTIGEYAEEVVGGVMNALIVGDQTLDTNKDTGVFNLDNNIDTFLGVSLFGGAISSVKTLGYRTPKYTARHNMTEADNAAAQIFGNQDTWGDIRNTIAVGDDADVKAKLKEVLSNPDVSAEQKLATLQYAKTVQEYKGVLAGETKRRAEQAPVQTDLETSYDNGYMLEGQEMNDAKNMLDFQRQRIGEIAADDMLQQLDEEPVSALDFIRTNEDWSDEEKQTAIDYVNAKATYEGMLQRVADDVDGRMAESDRLISERTSKTDGMIHPAVLKAENKQVYIVDGNVMMMPDGSMVDSYNSDESIIVRDAETGEISFVSPADILMVEEALDAEEERQTAQEAIRQQFAQQAADEIEGVLQFNDGDVYDVIDEEGQQHTIEIVPAGEVAGTLAEGQVLVSVDGAYIPIAMSRNEIQNMADAYNLTRLAEYEQAKAAQRAKEAMMTLGQTEQDAEMPENYAQNSGENIPVRDSRLGRSLNEEEADDLMLETIDKAERIESKELTRENWKSEFPNSRVSTPLGEVKMGEHQYEKLQEKGRAGEFGMIKPTLSRPDFVIEQASSATDGQDAERKTSLLFVKSFIGDDGKKRYFFKSVTVRKDGLEVNVSNYIDRPARVREALKKGKLLWMRTELASNSSDVNQGLYNQPGNISEPAVEGRVNPQRTSSSDGKGTDFSDSNQEIGQKNDASMPMIGEGEDAEPDFMAVTPERAHSYLYNEAGLSRDEANQFVEANKKAADKELEKAKKGKPTMGTSLAKYKKEQSEYQQKVDAAQQVADYWQQVKDAQQRVLSAELDARAAEDAAATSKAKAEEQQRQEEELRKQAEQAALGANNVAPAIREKWDAAPKVEGARNEIVLANGERVPGKYVLVESGAATPSHNPRAEFAKNEGYPVDENGQSVNDRDYEHDKDAQTITRQIADNYDQRALQSPVVVSKDGIVMSGNGRTMAGELAAAHNTDGAYIDYLTNYGSQYGFTPEQVGSMDHPRVVFVPDADMPYNAETYAKFNQQEMKGQSKTEQAVKLGKIVDDNTFGRIIRSINKFETLGDFYNDANASTQAIGELLAAGAISQAQYAEMFDGDAISAQGREILENMLIGKAFESNPDAVRRITSTRSMRQSIITALAEISNNLTLGEDYSLEEELSQAIALVYDARKNGNYKFGDKVSGYARQGNLFAFDEGATVADYSNATTMMLADVINDNRVTRLKKWLIVYNNAAQDSANGQIDLFTGDIKSRDEIINEVKQLLNYGTEEEIKQQLEEAAEQRKAEAEQSLSEDGTGSESNEGDGVSGISTQEAILEAEQETDTEPTEAQKEAGNYKKGHVRIDGYDVTIENPKGSVRRGVDANGKEWEQTMHNTYGYIRGTEGVDGDHIDVFLSDHIDDWNGMVYVVDQVNPNADASDAVAFDEHKVMYGFNSAEEASAAYLSNYEEGWRGLGAITGVTKDEFKKWVESSHRKTKPFADYKSVKAVEGQSEEVALKTQQTELKPVGHGAFGDIYDQFKGKAKEAIDFLIKKRSGEAIGALHHKDIGDIDLVWGEEGTGRSDGYGLAKLVKYHPDVLENLQEILDDMHVTTRSDNRVNLESDTHQAAVRLTWDNQKETWLLTAFEKKNSALGNTTDTGETSSGGKRNDTATPRSTVSAGKGTENNNTEQENEGKSSQAEISTLAEEYTKASREWFNDTHDDALYRSYQKALGRLEEHLRSLSEEELDGLEDVMGADYARIERKVKEEMARRRMAAAVMSAFEEGLQEQGAIAGRAKAPVVATDGFTSRDETKQVLNGIYHDESGHAVATDGSILVADKRQYDEGNNGKIVASHKVGDYRKGDVIPGNYPKWKMVVDGLGGGSKASVAWEGLRGFLASAEEVLKARWKAAKENKETKESFASWSDGIVAAIRMPNGEICTYNYNKLRTFADAAADMGMEEVSYGAENPLKATNKNGAVLLMPMHPGTITEAETGTVLFYEWSDAMRMQKVREAEPRAIADAWERQMRDGLVGLMREAGIEVSTDWEEGQRVLDEVNGMASLMGGGEMSERRKEREEQNRAIDTAVSLVTGRDIKDVRRKRIENEEQRRRQAKEIYDIILSGEYNDVSLQKISDYINDVTPNNPYGRRLSERLPQRVERKVVREDGLTAVDTLFSRASESSVAPNERVSASGRRAIEERKKEALEQWAKATGNWHTDLNDFTDGHRLISDDTSDSDVYLSKDGQHVIKLSRGKQGKRFAPDIDNIPLFNYVFPSSAYKILGYGDFGKGFVRILEQPYIDFETSEPLTEQERVEFMDRLGFKPINKSNTAFGNGEIIVADLQKNNVVKDGDGNIHVIDADCKLHTKDVGGNYTYFPVEHDLPEGIREMRAYHGSGADFDAFDHSHMGGGEGAQAVKTGEIDLPEIGQKMHAVDVTPEMRESVMEGQPMFFRTESRQAYGFTLNGKIYLDPRIATSETPIHEYAHMWAQALRQANPEAWERLKEEMQKEQDVLEYVKRLYPELDGADGVSDELLDEVFTHYAGKRGAERLRHEMETEMAGARGIFEKARVANVFAKLREMLDKFWGMARDLFAGKNERLKDMSGEDFADMMMGDLLGGFKAMEAADAGWGVSGRTADHSEDISETNRRFNEQLSGLTEENAREKQLDCGMPSDILLSCGIENKPIRLYGAKLLSKARKHGYEATEMRNLPGALATPIAVFTGSKDGSFAILTELQIKGKNVLVSLSVGKGGHDVDFNIISSVYGKRDDSIVRWINGGKMLYVNKEKALAYISVSAPIAEAQYKQELESAAKVVENFENPKVSGEKDGESSGKVITDADADSKLYRMREEEPPVRTGIGYKVFVLKDGKLYPPMVANPNGEDTPVGVWLDADAAPVAGLTKTGRQQVKAGGKGTQGGSGMLAYRPGWHLGEIPYALQFGRINPETGKKELFPANFVWAEVEYANDVDYQQEAHDAGVNANGKYQHSLAGLPYVPVNGSYKYRTNPNPETDPWIITGAMKVKRILKPSEVDELVKAAGREPQQREAGAVTDEQVDALNKEIRAKEVQKRFGELNEKYNGKPCSIIMNIDETSDDDFRKAIGISDEMVAEDTPEELHEDILKAKEDIKERKVAGGYSPDTRKIVIFAENIRSLDNLEEGFFHENLHGILHDWYEDGQRGIAERFFDVAQKEGGFVNWDFVDKRYEHLPESKKEEFFVYSLSRAMVQGRVGEILDMLADEDSERVDNILSTIGYDRRTEEASRRAKEAEGGKEVQDEVQRSLGQNDQGLLLERDGQPVLSQEDSFASSRAAGYTKKQHEAYWQRIQRNMRNAAEDWVKKLHMGDRVTIVDSVDDIDTNIKGRKRRAKGWFDRKTGKIVIVLGNHGSAADVVRTVLHEGVSHYGLRKLFGRNFLQFLDNVYENADNDVRSDIAELAAKYGWDFHTATEEYLARLAEDTDFENAQKKGWFSKIKSLFLDMLHSLGLSSYGGAALTTNELRYILWRSYENLAEPGRYRNLFDVAKDVVVQDKLGVGNYARKENVDNEHDELDMAAETTEQRMAKMLKDIKKKHPDAFILFKGSDGFYYSLDPKELEKVAGVTSFAPRALDEVMAKLIKQGKRVGIVDGMEHAAEEVAEDSEDILARDGDFSERDRVTARDAYERMVSSGLYQFREAVQDSMLGLKKLYEAIVGKGKRIEDVDGFENAYLSENRMSSVNAAEQHDYYINFMRPLLKAISAIAGSKKGARQGLIDYMMAKHGLERNLVFAERDAREVEANGGSFADAYNKFRQNDYSGLTALTGESDLSAAEAAAQQIVDDYEAAYDTGDLWDRTREATQATLEKIFRSGLLSKEQYEKIRDMFQYYIPLQGWDETTSDEVYGYLTSRSGIGGSPIKHAVGRSSKADDPIATIAMMADSAIRNGNRNQMKQRFLNFVQNHPSDLVSVHDLWLQYDDTADEWKPVFADIEAGDTAADVERKVEAFEQRMEQLAQAEPDKYKRGRDAKNIPYKVVMGNLKEHQVLVKRSGQTYILTINGNPRAAQALNGLTNPDVETGGVVGNLLKAGEYINRNLSAFYTTRNPDFVVSNFFRDMLYSNCMTWVKESPRYALRFHKNFGKLNPATMRRLLGKWEKGTLDQSNYTERMFYQFMMNGGETGYTSVLDIEAHKKKVAEELKRYNSVGRKAWAALGLQLDLLNRGVENCARFAAFVTSREMGRSIDRSVYDAKEVSVNFNKKGSGGKMVNATGQTVLGKIGAYIGGGGRLMWVFWNAGVQGMTNFGRAGKRHSGKAIAGASAMFILGYVIPQLASLMGGGDGDDDDKNAYYNLPEYVRRSNICFRAGEQWITIPLPIEFRGIYGLGELASGVISGNEYYDDNELSYQIASQVSQVLPLDMLEGGGGITPFIPSGVKPFVEAYILNRAWTGMPIYKDTPWNQNDPEWTKAYKSADQTLVDATRWLNEHTGGDDFKKGAIDINPSKLEYLLNGIFGGYANTAGKLKKMGETAFGDREFEWRNILLANRVVKSGDERTANRKLQNEYFKYKKEYDETKRLLKKYENAADEGIAGMAEKVDFIHNSSAYMRYEVFDEYRSDIDDYREDIKNAADDAERRELEAEMYATMRELIDRLHEVK